MSGPAIRSAEGQEDIFLGNKDDRTALGATLYELATTVLPRRYNNFDFFFATGVQFVDCELKSYRPHVSDDFWTLVNQMLGGDSEKSALEGFKNLLVREFPEDDRPPAAVLSSWTNLLVSLVLI
jgi:hypothetical protein